MSVALHAGLALVVLRGRSGQGSDPPKPPAQVEAEPIEVEFLPPPPLPPVAVGPVGEPAPRLATRDRERATRVERAAPIAPPNAAVPTASMVPAPAGPTRSLAMRAAADLQIHGLHEGAPETRAEPNTAIAGEPAAPLAHPAAPDSGEPDPRQTHEGFSLRSEPDGTAHLHDTRNLRWVLGVPTKGDVRTWIAGWQDELADAYSGKPKDYCNYPERPIEHPIGSIGATVMKFDVTDWMMRRHGDDPYASAKLAQLDATRAERVQAGARYRQAELGHAGVLAQRNLETLWATVANPAERKRALFALWDECSDSGTDADVEAGARARARIVAFIREHLAAGTPNAFTAGELAALNRDKQSREVFAPYAD
jgi:hypothetical protein